MSKINTNRFILVTFSDRLINLFLIYLIYQFVLHLYFAISANDLRLIMPTSVAFFHDMAILAIVTAVCHGVTTFAREKYKRIANLAFIIILIITGVFLSTYPKLLREYLVFPVNIFEADISSTKTLLMDYLGLSSLAPIFIAFFLGLISASVKHPISRFE
jgi:cytochrome bd-type quinol oxidase subunit 2